jgi:hypothetical protein
MVGLSGCPKWKEVSASTSVQGDLIGKSTAQAVASSARIEGKWLADPLSYIKATGPASATNAAGDEVSLRKAKASALSFSELIVAKKGRVSAKRASWMALLSVS